MEIAAGELRREGLRLFRRLREPGYYVRRLDDGRSQEMSGALFGPRNSWRQPVLRVDMRIVSALHRTDLLRRKVAYVPARGSESVPECYLVSAAGEAWWRRQAGGAEPFRAQHQLLGECVIEEPGRGVVRRQVNLGETPLGWLRKRKGPDGRPFLSDIEMEAGERLRRDYTLAALGSRVTADWSAMAAHVDQSRSGPSSGGDVSLAALDARRRVERALASVGPGLGDVLLETCCYLSGLEQAEQLLGWPQRSAKIVLKIALARIATHYGLGLTGTPKQGLHVWRMGGDGKHQHGR